MKNLLVSSTIAGPRTEAHWDSYVDALSLELGPDDEHFVDSLVPPGHASTHGCPASCGGFDGGQAEENG